MEFWYCICRVGVRVVGMCFYIVVVIWYFSSVRYGSDKLLGVRDWCNVGVYFDNFCFCFICVVLRFYCIFVVMDLKLVFFG